jgi:alanyl-tRNA synthetase
VIADHLRATSFLVADGVLPSNEGRGYVLRRIMRRAMRHAHLLGARDPVMHRLVPALVAQMGRAFPELTRAQPLIEETLLGEETRFKATLDRGLRMLDDELARLSADAALPGAAVFRLYDTYGFPLDLTQDALREQHRTVDVAGFEAAMAEQKAKARAAWAGSGEAAEEGIWFDLAEQLGPTEFLGYDTETAEGQVLALVADGRPVDRAGAGQAVQIVLNQTPFYAESGGQVGDTGALRSGGARVAITDVRKKAGLFVHSGRVEAGELTRGAAAELAVDHARRTAIRANHSATHLLHEALRRALGEHVAQRGSLVAPDRLRFDFTHGRAMSAAEMAAVEAEVNGYVRQNTPVETRIMTPEQAQALGARALFGEKYGDEVRVVAMGSLPDSGIGPGGDTYSLELCGGTHVRRTGDIGAFKLVSEGATSSGVRRIEALTGAGALAHVAAEEAALNEAAALLRARPDELPERVRALLDERKAQAQEIAELRRRLAMGGAAAAEGPETVAGIPFLAQSLSGVSGKDLRGLIDEHKARLKSGVILLVADTGAKAAVAAGVTDDLTGRISAVDLVRVAAEALGGRGGGGRPDMAQAGGADASRAPQAIAAARALLEA